MSPNARLQLGGAERLRDVVIRTGIEERHFLDIRMPSREHDDWRGRPPADVPAHLDAFEIRQPEVEDDQVDSGGRSEIDSCLPRGSLQNVRDHVFQRVSHHTADLGLVVYDQNRRVIHRNTVPPLGSGCPGDELLDQRHE